jgi:hypothetical protein
MPTFNYIDIQCYIVYNIPWISERWDGVDWIGLAKDRNRWGAVVNSVLNLRVP